MFDEIQALEERRLLSQKVKLDDGTYGHLFSTSEGENVVRWHCHMCDIFVVGFGNLHMHIAGKKHQQKLSLPSHPKAHFPKIERDEFDDDILQLAPGEPVPPGFEDKVRRVTQIQAELDKVNNKPLIGLEYLLELTDELGNSEPKYVCLLCEKKGERHVVLGHLTSFEHYNKYVGMYFPTASKAMTSAFPKTKDGKKAMLIVLTNICHAIEKVHGRLQPMAVDKHTFEAKKNKYLAHIVGDHHFREKPGETFVELVAKNILGSVRSSSTDPQVPWDDKSKDDGLSTFNKKKIAAAQLRTRDIESSYEKKESSLSGANKSLKTLSKEKDTTPRRSDRSPVGKRPSLDITEDSVDADNMGKSPLSSISSTSISRSRSRSKSRSRKKARARSRSYSPSVSRTAYNSNYRESRLDSSRSLHKRTSRVSPVGNPPYSRYRYKRSKSNSRSRSRSRSRTRQRNRSHSKSPIRSHHQKKDSARSSPSRKISPKDDSKPDEKSKWETFRHEVDKIEREAAKLLKFHEQNPEKHPLYPDEWKKFWSIRYKELQAEGKDPNKHDFKPEWIEFWNKRMLFLHKEDVKDKKEQLKKKLGLPKEEPIPTVTIKRKAPLHINKDVLVVCTDDTKNIVSANDKKRSKSPTKHTESTLKNNRSNHSPLKEPPKEREAVVKPKIPEKKLKEKPKIRKEMNEETSVHEREETRKPEREETRKPEREEARKYEREEARKYEREEAKKYEREEARKFEREEARKFEREEARKFEREEARKFEREEARKFEREEARKFEREEARKYEREEARKREREETKKPDVIKSTEEAEIVPILRILTAMESQLGSLGPKVNTLMGRALSLEKIELHSADSLLTDPENIVLFGTVKEKLKGQLMAGIVEKNMLSATQTALDLLVNILKKIDEKTIKPAAVLKLSDNLMRPVVENVSVLKPSVNFVKPVVENVSVLKPSVNFVKPVVENVSVVKETKPVDVTEVNPLDKVAIAQQIAAALVAQGKTDVTQDQLEQLINIFTGMAQASKGSGSVISTAQFVAMQQQQQQQQQQMVGGTKLMHVQNPAPMMPNISTVSKEPVTALQQLLSVVTSKPSSSYTVSASESSKGNVSGLQLLQNAYEEPRNSPVTNSIVRGDKQHIISPQGAIMSMDQKKQHPSENENRTGKEISYLSEVELQTLLQNFKDLSAHEQQCLITYLRKLEESDPVRVEQLRKYVVIEPPVKKSPLDVTPKPTPPPERLQIAGTRRGRLSPFSQRQYSSNPIGEAKESKNPTYVKETEKRNSGDDSDEEYTYEEIYAAASKKVRESEEAKAKEKAKELEKERASAKRNESSSSASKKSNDPAILLRETKAMIANLMGQLPSKYPNKHSPVPSPRREIHVINSASKQDSSQLTTANVSNVYPANTQSYGGTYDSGQSTQHFPAGDTSNNVASTQQHYHQYQQSDYSTPYGAQQETEFSNTMQYQNNYSNDYSNSYDNQPTVTPSQEYSNYGVPPQNTYPGDDYNQYGQNSYQEQNTDYSYPGQNRTYY